MSQQALSHYGPDDPPVLRFLRDAAGTRKLVHIQLRPPARDEFLITRIRRVSPTGSFVETTSDLHVPIEVIVEAAWADEL